MPVRMFWEMDKHDFRPFTLVFAKERSEQGIKDALINGRTAAYAMNTLIGREKYVREIFEKSVVMEKQSIEIKGRHWVNLMIKNNSSLPYNLVSKKKFDEIRFDDELTLAPNKTVILGIGGVDKELEGNKKLTLLFEVENVKTSPNTNLEVEFELDFTFVPDKK